MNSVDSGISQVNSLAVDRLPGNDRPAHHLSLSYANLDMSQCPDLPVGLLVFPAHPPERRIDFESGRKILRHPVNNLARIIDQVLTRIEPSQRGRTRFVLQDSIVAGLQEV